MNRKLMDLLKQRDYVIHTVKGDDSIKDAVHIMNEHRIGAVMVLNENDMIEGILTERDILRKLAVTENLVGHLLVKSIMTPRDKIIIGRGNDTVEQLMNAMTDNKIRHIPILDENNELMGLISMRDIIKILLKDSNLRVKHLNNYIMGNYPM